MRCWKIVIQAVILLLLLGGSASAAKLTVVLVGTGYGAVDGEDISCGSHCSATYEEKSIVHLEAEAYDDSTFEGWMVNGKPHKGTIVIDEEDIVIAARFDLKSPPDDLELMWYNGNNTQHAMMVLDEIAVFPAQRPENPYKLEGEYKTSMEEAARLFHPQAEVKEWGDFFVILKSPDPIPEEQLPETFETIRGHGYIREAAPVLYGNLHNPDSQVIPTGEILVEFPGSYSEEQILAIEQEYGLMRLKRGRDDLHDAVYQAGTPMESLEIANELYESGRVLYSSPELFTRAVLFNQLLEKDSFPDHWHLQDAGQNGADVVGAWNISDNAGTPIRGSGVVIVILDDGVEIRHPDLKPNINEVLSFDFVDSWGWGKEIEDKDPTPPINLAELHLSPDILFDEFKTFYGGHGTNVAGTAAAAIDERSDGKGVFGVAPEAQIVGYRLLGFMIGEDGQKIYPTYRGKDPRREALIRNRDKTDVYNRSLGVGAGRRPTQDPKILDELKSSVEAGNFLVNSAGNEREQRGNANYNGYAASRYVFAIAASTKEGSYASYSNPGANILVNAPCSGIPATDRMGEDGKNPFMDRHNTDYQDFDYTNSFGGTSAAAPVVSGIIALMLQANPGLDWRDVQHILIETADKNPGEDWGDKDHLNKAGYSHSYNYGFGRINAKKAVEAALLWNEDTVPDELENPILGKNKKKEKIPPGGELSKEAGIIEIEDNIKIEFVEVTLDVQHHHWCELEVVLTSPTETTSTLSPLSSCYTDQMSKDERYGFKKWRFGSVRHFGEPSKGEWKLTIKNTNPDTEAKFIRWEIDFYGTELPEEPSYVQKVQVSSGGDIIYDAGWEASEESDELGFISYTAPIAPTPDAEAQFRIYTSEEMETLSLALPGLDPEPFEPCGDGQDTTCWEGTLTLPDVEEYLLTIRGLDSAGNYLLPFADVDTKHVSDWPASSSDDGDTAHRLGDFFADKWRVTTPSRSTCYQSKSGVTCEFDDGSGSLFLGPRHIDPSENVQYVFLDNIEEAGKSSKIHGGSYWFPNAEEDGELYQMELSANLAADFTHCIDAPKVGATKIQACDDDPSTEESCELDWAITLDEQPSNLPDKRVCRVTLHVGDKSVSAELQSQRACEELVSLPEPREGGVETIVSYEWEKIGVVERGDCKITGTTDESSETGMTPWINIYTPLDWPAEDCDDDFNNGGYFGPNETIVVKNPDAKWPLPFTTAPESTCPPRYPQSSCVVISDPEPEEEILVFIPFAENPCWNGDWHGLYPTLRECRMAWDYLDKVVCYDHQPIRPTGRRFSYTASTKNVSWECEGQDEEGQEQCEFQYARTMKEFAGDSLPELIAVFEVREPEEAPQ